jgi:glutathione S-transferase
MPAAPILYSFRRCPYAIRARLALAAAGWRPGIHLELREVSLRAKPPELLQASPIGTVPVLVLPAVQQTAVLPPQLDAAADVAADAAPGAAVDAALVLDQSLAIMRWALEHPPAAGAAGADGLPGWWAGRGGADREAIETLIAENDGPFKHHLDRFKYPDRFPGETSAEHRLAGLAILRGWNERLVRHGGGTAPPAASGGWLLGDRPSLADWALLPFVRQFRLADPQAFDAAPDLGALQGWLQRFLGSPELAAVMEAPWGLRRSWRSPRWLYHLALAEEWRSARRDGVYVRSTRGLTLQQVGFIHASHAHQLDATWRRFYADAGEVVLLHIDPDRLAAAGVPVRLESAPDSGEQFPHLYGPLPLQAVRLAEPFQLVEAGP